ncbi:hypothetical protein HUJ04_000476 [Dendroctonus ponderosae]|nr:hypothetical protein HUJ04_000476 [Dendroctonus ponderosae]
MTLKEIMGSVQERQQITSTIQHFYKELYSQSVPKPNRAKIEVIRNEDSEDIPEIDTAELRIALKQIKNQKAPGEDLQKGKIPDTWRNAEVIILSKNVPLHLAFVDYQKTFDHMSNASIDDQEYKSLIEDIYKDVTVHREAGQGDSISPKLFTLAVEDVFRKLSWQQKRVNMHGIYLNNLRSAEDILLINTNAGELSNMLHDLREASQMVIEKTKITSPDNICVTIDNHALQAVE